MITQESDRNLMIWHRRDSQVLRQNAARSR